MSEVSRICDQARRAYAGPAWHGPSLSELLAGVTAEMAARHPVAGAHSIWEIVLHTGGWMDVAVKRIETMTPSMPDQDWPAAGEASEAGWREALDALAAAEQRFEELIRSLSDERLRDRIPDDQPQSIYFLLHGVVQHNLYHAGQIALLKKAAAEMR